MTFAAGLRALLRADPDVLLVGEIRDGETADIAMKAALTGHLVLTTVHAADSATALSRLDDMGVSANVLVGSIRCVISQRLVRHLCPECREQHELDEAAQAARGFPVAGPFYRAVGCVQCADTGYRGRFALYEIVTGEALAGLLATVGNGAGAALAGRFTGLHAHALEACLTGATSLEEVERVIGSPPPVPARPAADA
jgi:type II secretory ATPase GspE/PulE/Tfp pilus assembly ATPase PilB-like protein